MRLSNAIKNEIIKNAINKSGIIDKFYKLIEKRVVFAEKCRVLSLGGIDESIRLEKIYDDVESMRKNLPEGVGTGWNIIDKDSFVYCSFGGMQESLRFSGTHSKDKPQYLTDSQYKIRSNKRLNLDGQHELSLEFLALVSEQCDLNNQYMDIEIKVKATLDSFTTTEKLLKAWPESIELIPKELKPIEKKLPAICSDDLNQMLGLPTGDKS